MKCWVSSLSLEITEGMADFLTRLEPGELCRWRSSPRWQKKKKLCARQWNLQSCSFHSEMQNTHICNLIQPDGIAFAGYWCSCFVFGCVAKLIPTEVISYPPAYNSRFNIVWGFEPSGCLRKLISFTVTEEINLFLLQRRKTKYWEQMILVSIYS